MKQMMMALLAGLLMASAQAQTSLDRKGQTENIFVRKAREAEEKKRQEVASANAAAKADLEAARAKNRALMAELEAKGVRTISGTVLSVIVPGEQVLIQCDGQSEGPAQCYFKGERVDIPDFGLPNALKDVVILLKTPKAFGTVVDRDRIKVLAGMAPETFEYTTALGAKSTVRVYGMVYKPNP